MTLRAQLTLVRVDGSGCTPTGAGCPRLRGHCRRGASAPMCLLEVGDTAEGDLSIRARGSSCDGTAVNRPLSRLHMEVRDSDDYLRRIVMRPPLGSRDTSAGLWLARPASSAQP
jgi:hypothetical protein